MQMIEIVALGNGAHRNQSYSRTLPDGWAIIRDGETLENFPFGSFETEEIDGVLYMKEGSWVAGEMPEDEPEPEPEDEPSPFDVLEAQVTYTAMMTDTLLEV